MADMKLLVVTAQHVLILQSGRKATVLGNHYPKEIRMLNCDR